MTTLPDCYRCGCQPCECKDGITLYDADCRDVLPLLEPGSVDLVLTDPPYNVGVDYGTHNDKMTTQEFIAWADQWFFDCRRISKTVLITGQIRLTDYAQLEPWKWLLCWWKPAAMGRSPVGFCNWEPVAMWGKGHSRANDVVRAPIRPSGEIDGHPCPKPLGWALGLLQTFPNATVVLDPFAGSGTTGRACKDLGRKCIMVEIEEKYCEIAARRLEQEVLFT